MIISIPIRRTTVRLNDSSLVEAYELIPGFARVTSENRADNDAQGGGHILVSNPLIEWGVDMISRGNLGTTEKIYIHLHTQPAESAPYGDSGVDITDNDSFV